MFASAKMQSISPLAASSSGMLWQQQQWQEATSNGLIYAEIIFIFHLFMASMRQQQQAEKERSKREGEKEVERVLLGPVAAHIVQERERGEEM